MLYKLGNVLLDICWTIYWKVKDLLYVLNDIGSVLLLDFTDYMEHEKTVSIRNLEKLLYDFKDKQTNRRLAKKDIKLILEYTDMSNLDNYWLEQGYHVIILTERGFESIWTSDSTSTGISFTKFKSIIAQKEAKKIEEELIRATIANDSFYLNDWDYRFNATFSPNEELYYIDNSRPKVTKYLDLSNLKIQHCSLEDIETQCLQ